MSRAQRSEYCDEVMRDNRRAVNRLAVEYASIERAANVVLDDIKQQQRELSAEARRSRNKSKSTSCWCYVKAASVATVALRHLRDVGGGVHSRPVAAATTTGAAAVVVATAAADRHSPERRVPAAVGASRGAAAAAAETSAGVLVLCSLHSRTAVADVRHAERRGLRLPPLRGTLKQISSGGSGGGALPKDDLRALAESRTPAQLPSIVTAAASSPARCR